MLVPAIVKEKSTKMRVSRDDEDDVGDAGVIELRHSASVRIEG